MKILHLTSHLKMGGITRYILSLSKKLVEHGHSVIIASDRGTAELQLGEINATHWRFPFDTSAEFSPKVLWGIQCLIKRLRKEPVDVIHAHTRVGQISADFISSRLKIPYITTWHGIYKARLGRRIWPCVGDLTVAISGPVREQLLQDFQIQEKCIRSIYNGIDTKYYAVLPDKKIVNEYRKKWQLNNYPVIGGIGRLAAGRVKGFDTLLVATRLLKKVCPEIQVIIAGDGPRRPFLEDVAKRLGVHRSVRFVGETQDIRIPLALMDVFVFSSRWPEAFGLTLVEAMAAAKPILATRVGAVPEIIRDGIDGYTVPVDDPLEMAKGIEKLLNDPVAAQEFGRQAQVRARDIFDIEVMSQKIEEVYREVLNQESKQGLNLFQGSFV